MTKADEKLRQYLDEAHAMEKGLVRTLQSQIAMSPRGDYRDALQEHLRDTRDHADRVAARLRQLGGRSDPVEIAVGMARDVAGQAIALAKSPLDLVRGTSGAEKVLKAAKDAAASEALEIATYRALEELARALSDERTAELAADIRVDEEEMLATIEAQLPALARAVAESDVRGRSGFDVAETGAADALRDVVREAGSGARDAARRAGRSARRAPGAERAEGVARGAAASADELPIGSYDELSATEVSERLPTLTQVQLGIVEAYERRGRARTTVLERIAALRGEVPWPGYDEMTASEIVERLRDGVGDDEAAAVRDYERAHRGRVTVMRAAERELASA